MKHPIKILIALSLVFLCAGCLEFDHKGLIEKTLDAREKAINEKNVEAYLALVSKDYKYKETSKHTLREFMEDNLLYWDTVHFESYNRLIYIDGNFARVTQDYQISVTGMNKKKGKMETWKFSDPEHLILKKEGWLKPRWKFYQGLDNS